MKNQTVRKCNVSDTEEIYHVYQYLNITHQHKKVHELTVHLNGQHAGHPCIQSLSDFLSWNINILSHYIMLFHTDIYDYIINIRQTPAIPIFVFVKSFPQQSNSVNTTCTNYQSTFILNLSVKV